MSGLVMETEEKKFEEWLTKVDAICRDKLGSPVDCLPDAIWAEMHEVGLSPQEAFDEYYEDQFGETWEDDNGQFGVGA